MSRTGTHRLTPAPRRLARGELTTALDLLSVLAPVTDPPSIDPLSLPLPPQTLAVVPSRPPPPPPPSPAQASAEPDDPTTLPVALSLASLRASATAFLAASVTLAAPPPRPSPWPTLLRLRATTAYTLLPLGAARGATLTGKGDSRAAREVGLFYGCPEARESFRRAAVARVDDLAEKHRGRTLVVKVVLDGVEQSVAWGPTDDAAADEDDVERTLAARGRAAFAEEIFATVRTRGLPFS